MSGSKLRLRRFDINSISSDKVVVFIGKRETGKSFLVKDMFDYFKENFGLKYKIGKPRISEKIHEVMIAKEELGRVADPGKYYLMHYKNTYNDEVLLKNNEYNSKDFAVSKKDLETILKETI